MGNLNSFTESTLFEREVVVERAIAMLRLKVPHLAIVSV